MLGSKRPVCPREGAEVRLDHFTRPAHSGQESVLAHCLPSYVAALELRVEKLERRIEFARLRKASLVLHESDLPRPILDADRKDSMAVIRAAIHRKAARSRENSDVNSLISDFGYLCVYLLLLLPAWSAPCFGRGWSRPAPPGYEILDPRLIINS